MKPCWFTIGWYWYDISEDNKKVTHCLSFSSSLVAVSYCWSRYRFAASIDWIWATAVCQQDSQGILDTMPQGWEFSSRKDIYDEGVWFKRWWQRYKKTQRRRRRKEEKDSHRSSKLLLLLLWVVAGKTSFNLLNPSLNSSRLLLLLSAPCRFRFGPKVWAKRDERSEWSGAERTSKQVWCERRG